MVLAMSTLVRDPKRNCKGLNAVTSVPRCSWKPSEANHQVPSLMLPAIGEPEIPRVDPIMTRYLEMEL